MSDHNVKSALTAIGAPRDCTLAGAIGATGIHTEEARGAGYEAALETEIDDE